VSHPNSPMPEDDATDWPRVLLREELSEVREIIAAGKATIDHYRSLALSIALRDDVKFLTDIVAGDNGSEASRALTALYYWGCTAGIGKFVEPWLCEMRSQDEFEGSPMLGFAPGILRDCVIGLGDVTAYDALSRATHESDDVRDAVLEVRKFLSEQGSVFHAELASGLLWQGGRYIISQIPHAERLRSTLVWFLKSVPPAPEVRDYLLSLVSQEDVRLVSIRALAGFSDFIPSADLLSDTVPTSSDDLTIVFNLTLQALERTHDRTYLRVLKELAENAEHARVKAACERAVRAFT